MVKVRVIRKTDGIYLGSMEAQVGMQFSFNFGPYVEEYTVTKVNKKSVRCDAVRKWDNGGGAPDKVFSTRVTDIPSIWLKEAQKFGFKKKR